MSAVGAGGGFGSRRANCETSRRLRRCSYAVLGLLKSLMS